MTNDWSYEDPERKVFLVPIEAFKDSPYVRRGYVNLCSVAKHEFAKLIHPDGNILVISFVGEEPRNYLRFLLDEEGLIDSFYFTKPGE